MEERLPPPPSPPPPAEEPSSSAPTAVQSSSSSFALPSRRNLTIKTVSGETLHEAPKAWGGPEPSSSSSSSFPAPRSAAAAPVVEEIISTSTSASAASSASSSKPPTPRDASTTHTHTHTQAPPTKRESLRSFGPLIRRYSQEIKNASPWAIALNSTRVKEKRHLETGITKFNLKPTSGIDYLCANGIIHRSPEEVARFLSAHNGELSKKRVGEYVGGHDVFAQEVLHRLLREFDFNGLAIDEAMRMLIKNIRLPGEAQQIDRVLQKFAFRYYECNRNDGVYATEDTVYILSFSVMLLNTDLHNRNLRPQEKMTMEGFVRNNRGINEGKDLPRELLVSLYHSIKRNEMRMKEGDMFESDSLTFMAPRISGWLDKKSQGRFGLWHRLWFVLTPGGCLYYFKGPREQDPRCIIMLENVTAIKGSTPLDIILYSNDSTAIKSVKISKTDKTMTRGTHTRYLLRATTKEERDDWLEALQTETGPFLRQHRVGSNTATQTHTHTHTGMGTGSLATTTMGGGGGGNRTSTVVGGGGLAHTQTVRSPRSAGGLFLQSREKTVCVYHCLAEGWMRRRSDVNRAWQRRYFMLLIVEKEKEKGSKKEQEQQRRTELFWFTTQEMSQRMFEIGVPTQQGSVVLDDATSLRVRTSTDILSYRPPEPAATIFELESYNPQSTTVSGSKVKELISPEDGEALGYWMECLKPYVVQQRESGRVVSGKVG